MTILPFEVDFNQILEFLKFLYDFPNAILISLVYIKAFNVTLKSCIFKITRAYHF